MHKLLFFLFFMLALGHAQAQNCESSYASLQEGTTLEYTNFNKKGELESVFQHACKNVEQENDTLIAWFDVNGKNDKGEETFKGLFSIKCLRGVVFADMRSLVPASASAPPNMDAQVEVDGGGLEFPSDMKPGQELPDGEMEIRFGSEGMQLLKMHFVITNRKVEAAEKITTKAGEFDCLRISYDLEFKLVFARKLRTMQWYAPNVGLIKSESYDKKGKLEGSMELTMLKR